MCDESSINSGDSALDGVLSDGIHSPASMFINIDAIVGQTYDFQMLFYGSQSSINNGTRVFDILVDGVLFADEFMSNNGTRSIYDFSHTATSNTIAITFGSGSSSGDGNAFVQGIIVEDAKAIPEPSIIALMSLGLLGFVATRRRIQK